MDFNWLQFIVSLAATMGIAAGVIIWVKKSLVDFFVDNFTLIDTKMEEYLGQKNADTLQKDGAEMAVIIAENLKKMSETDSFQE